MSTATIAQMNAKLEVVVVLLRHVCEELPAPLAAAVSDSVHRTLSKSALAVGDDADAAQAAILAPLLAALRR